MAKESKKKQRLEIAHVLFIDIVGYSKLRITQQSELLRELNQIVSETNEFREADAEGKLIRLPTGDGMALVFRTNLEAPVQCAVEIGRALKNRSNLQLRMGVHSGPVDEIADVNQRSNIAGTGINIAQRVMDCGDAGHILLSKHVADDLEHYDHWRPLLHDLGTCEVKHGVRISLVNLYADQVGNPRLPEKFKALKKLSPLGEHDHAIAELKRAVELDPFSAIINTELGLSYIAARRYPERSYSSAGQWSWTQNFLTLATYWAKRLYSAVSWIRPSASTRKHTTLAMNITH